MNNTFLVITSIAGQDHPILQQIAAESSIRNLPFILIGDTKSPSDFQLSGCEFYSIKQQSELPFELPKVLPTRHYARKNIGYLIAMANNADCIIETDDDNIPYPAFYRQRERETIAHHFTDTGWMNVYQHFTDVHIWPRGFALEHIQRQKATSHSKTTLCCPIQQGLVDDNPDTDAIYRLVLPLPVTFTKSDNIALGNRSFCPFNSQNTTWFREAFPLLYLPFHCSFRMTDIWRSFIAQRIAWTCGWSVLFHQSTARQERNVHNLMNDFCDELVGYTTNAAIYDLLAALNLKSGVENIPENMRVCYKAFIKLGIIGEQEMTLLNAWLNDVKNIHDK
jgi:hypothetical protein